ncbi:MAG: hypothetical protein IKG96_00015 [Bacteroidaceae bacterium]|nr:hypothetical protein [Bacteroidaceae bacterium]
MNKKYISPVLEQEFYINAHNLCVSGVNGTGDVDATYGGVDESGTEVPSSKQREDFDPLLVGQTDGWISGLW